MAIELKPEDIVKLYKKHGIRAKTGLTNVINNSCCVLGILYFDKTLKSADSTDEAMETLGFSHEEDYGLVCGFDEHPDDEEGCETCYGKQSYHLGIAINKACKEAGLFE